MFDSPFPRKAPKKSIHDMLSPSPNKYTSTPISNIKKLKENFDSDNFDSEELILPEKKSHISSNLEKIESFINFAIHNLTVKETRILEKRLLEENIIRSDYNYKCKLCNNIIIREPAITKCNHIFCLECIKLYITRNGCCPCCDTYLNSDDICYPCSYDNSNRLEINSLESNTEELEPRNLALIWLSNRKISTVLLFIITYILIIFVID